VELAQSVGAQVATPWVGGGVSVSQKSGSDNASGTSKAAANDTQAFDAVGGDTTLASQPQAWVASVADFRNWRVVERSSLAPIVDILSAIPGFTAVKRVVNQAVPVLSKYLMVDPKSKELVVRFKFQTPPFGLNFPHLYLGHSGLNPDSIIG
jgi:hypothetical protein